MTSLDFPLIEFFGIFFFSSHACNIFDYWFYDNDNVIKIMIAMKIKEKRKQV